MTLRVKNWTKFQHYKDRNPPWIRLYRDLLNDPEWFALSDGASRLLANLWLLAAEDPGHQGKLPDARTIAFRLRLDSTSLAKHLSELNHWVIEDASTVLAERKQVGTPETETDTDTETETSTTTAPNASRSAPKKLNGGRISFDFSKGAFQGISEEDELRWQEAFPAVPIPPEIERAAAWLRANPANRKKNCERFLVNWFSRAQDKAARVRL